MFKYLKGLFSFEPTSPLTKGVLLGLDDVGKTTLLHKLKNGKITSVKPIIGLTLEVFESPSWHLTSWDVGGCDKFRPLWRHYVVDIDFMLFVIDLSEDDRFDEAKEELRQIARHMKPANGPGQVFVLLNKQDLLGREEREKRVEQYKVKIMAKMTTDFGDKLRVEVMDMPGLNVRSGKGLNGAMAHIKRVLTGEIVEGGEQFVDGEKAAPVPAPLSREQLIERVREFSAVAEPDDDVFWGTFLSAKMHLWDHYTHLRAGYFVLLQQLEKENDVFAAAEDFLHHLERLRTVRPDKFKNTAHRTMTTFWLMQLERAARDFAAGSRGAEGSLKRENFRDVVMANPELMNGGLWKDYYSKELMFSQDARSGWKEPDLMSLKGKNLRDEDATLGGDEVKMSEKSEKF